jgi:hypothetical protein
MPDSHREGGCLCGAVRYRVPQAPLQTVTCHCTHCQKQSGGAFSVVAVYRRDDLALEGELATFEDRGTSGQTVFRQFCPRCGSPVITDTERAREQQLIFVKAGTLDDVQDLKPGAHCWWSSSQPWLRLGDDGTRLERE